MLVALRVDLRVARLAGVLAYSKVASKAVAMDSTKAASKVAESAV